MLFTSAWERLMVLGFYWFFFFLVLILAKLANHQPISFLFCAWCSWTFVTCRPLIHNCLITSCLSSALYGPFCNLSYRILQKGQRGACGTKSTWRNCNCNSPLGLREEVQSNCNWIIVFLTKLILAGLKLVFSMHSLYYSSLKWYSSSHLFFFLHGLMSFTVRQ